MSQYIEDALPIVKYNGLNTTKAVDFSGAASVAQSLNHLNKVITYVSTYK